MKDKFNPSKDHKGDIPSDTVIPEVTPVKITQNGMNGHLEPEDKEQEDEPEVKTSATVGFFQLFRYATGFDNFLIAMGSLCAVGMGCAIPINLLIYGEVLDRFIDNAASQIPFNGTTELPTESLRESISDLILYFVAIGGSVIVLGYVEISCWTMAAERQTRRIRALCYKSVLKQHIGWFDVHETGEINTRLTDDIGKIQAGIGDKFGLCIQWFTTFIAGYTLGFIRGWQLTLVIVAVAPIIVLAIGILQFLMQRLTKNEQAAYAKAGAVAEEVLSSIRTVLAFGGEKKEVARYDQNLITAEKSGRRKGLMTGSSVGFVWLSIFSAFALAFWYGTTLVAKGQISGGDVLQVFFGVLQGTMSLGNLAPYLENIANARGSAAAVYELIEMESEIDSSSEEGTKPKITGNVEFRNIEFNYPSRHELTILQGFNLKVNTGSTVALVGPSGCGKSTTVQLLQRFYDPINGAVYVDGNDISEMNVKWLREHVGVVSQEPILFACSIAENIQYGRDGVTQADIEQAAKNANAYDFIMQLPEKFETPVGERGSQLSGGQKQRIAIARALVRNPKILLLDEATSALDTESESIVQSALDQASKGRTTIVIAHRLSTIRNADVIVGIQDGNVVEQGSHNELMKQEGLYHGLVMSQTAAAKKDTKVVEDPLEDFEKALQETELPPKLERTMSGPRGSSHFRERTVSMASGGSMRSSMRRKGPGRSMSVTSDLSDSWSVKEEMDHAAKLPPAPMVRIMKMNSPEWPFIVVACFASIFVGAVQPSFAIVFSEIIGNFAEEDTEKQQANASIYSGILFAIGVVVGSAQLCQAYFFSIAGEALTKRLRSKAFSSMLRQEIGWFDNRENQVGALTARLATDASQVRGAAGQQIGTMIQAFMTIGVALIIAFVFSWKLALVVIAFLPAMIFAGIAQGMLMQGFGKKDQAAVEEGGKIAVETIDNIRTVAALNKEDYFYKKYDDHFEDMYRKGIKKSHVYGISYSFGQSVIYFAYAAAFSFGADLIENEGMPFFHVIRVFGALTFSGQALGRAFTLAPDLSKAKMSAAKLFALFDRESAIDSSNPSGGQPESCGGNVTFKNVKFRYPTRADVKVLQGLELAVTQGKTLALVGASGCGKSTTVQLLERFYDPEHGTVKLDDRDTRDLNIQWMRQQMGIVSQEPSLFDASIRDNIAYGDNSRDIPMDEIIAAARKANIHNFIEGLPQGYDTSVGDRGTQLSGGQKQRIAIARALVRNPKVLLLDEATSALDNESEKIVQEALDQARVGRTSIVIAHRLSTIQNSDIIAVIHNGVVVEQGAHHELMAKQGYYYRLQKAQNRSTDDDEL